MIYLKNISKMVDVLEKTFKGLRPGLNEFRKIIQIY
jgi:hypothetical protein